MKDQKQNLQSTCSRLLKTLFHYRKLESGHCRQCVLDCQSGMISEHSANLSESFKVRTGLTSPGPFKGSSKKCRNKHSCYYCPLSSSWKAMVLAAACSHPGEVVLRLRENSVSPAEVANEGREKPGPWC